jgi:DNA-binding HxlR family transcriptional regulator
MLDLIGDRWSLLILRDSIFWGKRRYGEFLATTEGISTNILAARLKQLEAAGMLEKFRDPQDGKVFLYIPTERGLKLVPVLLEAIRWGMSELEFTGIPDKMKPLLADGAEPYLASQRAQLAEERAALHNV